MQGDIQMVAKTRKPKAGSGVKAQSKALRKQGAKTQSTGVENDKDEPGQ